MCAHSGDVSNVGSFRNHLSCSSPEKWIGLGLALLAIPILTSCGSPATPEYTPAPSLLSIQPTSTSQLPDPTPDLNQFTVTNYPLVDGSTSTAPLQVLIACQILETECEWVEGMPFETGRRIMPVFEADPIPAEAEFIFGLWHSGTHGSYMNLIERNTDMILVAREPSEDELLSAGLGGVTLDVQPVALDAFVFLVHADNPIDSLSIPEIRSIYTGETTNWAELGNPDAEIHPYLRNPNSGSQELMEDLVMQGLTMIDAPDMILESMMGPFNAISTDPQGIGYSVYYYAQNIFPNEAVQMIAVDGVYPSSETIAEGEYPLSTEVYVVIRADTPPDSPARQLRDWLLTEAGQVVVAASGYVPMNPSNTQTEGS